MQLDWSANRTCSDIAPGGEWTVNVPGAAFAPAAGFSAAAAGGAATVAVAGGVGIAETGPVATGTACTDVVGGGGWPSRRSSVSVPFTQVSRVTSVSCSAA